MKKRTRLAQAAGMALAAAGLLTLLAGLGLLKKADLSASDALYQTRSASDGEIVLVGIDQRALEEIGPYSQWGRDIIAMALEALNQAEDCRPAVIAVDVLYTGETQSETDQWLAEAAGAYGNVITASAVQLGSALAEDSAGEYYLDRFSTLDYEQPFDALRDVTTQGHINAMLDTDGILRHHLLQITLPDGTQVPSMALAAARMYREVRGEEPPALPRTNSRGFWYLPFCGVPGDFDQSISVADLLSGDIPADFFAGRIVLIGPYAPGLQDSYLTAADHASPMYGVEYQANAIQALLWGEYKFELSDGVQLTILFILLLVSFAGFWRRRVWAATLLWAVLCGGWLAVCRGLYEQGTILHVLWVPVGVSVLYVGCIAANYIKAAMERREVTSRFKRYVAPEIVNEILKEGKQALALGGKRTNIAVLFVDVRGFTSMSERLAGEPERVVKILNRYLTLIADCILRNRGTLDKFVGDAAMAFWGAPLPQEDYVMNAAKAAFDMVKGSQLLAQELERDFGQAVSFGIGIHLGEAVVGNMGSERRMDYTAIGDTVNTAARLEANAPGGTIYISRAVADALEGRIRATPLAVPIKLKGKKDGFEILTLDEILE